LNRGSLRTLDIDVGGKANASPTRRIDEYDGFLEHRGGHLSGQGQREREMIENLYMSKEITDLTPGGFACR
jgi:hypothetical protein